MAKSKWELPLEVQEDVINWSKNQSRDFYRITTHDAKWKRKDFTARVWDVRSNRKHNQNNTDKYEEIKKELIDSTLSRGGILSNAEKRRRRQKKSQKNLSVHSTNYQSLVKGMDDHELTWAITHSVSQPKMLNPQIQIIPIANTGKESQPNISFNRTSFINEVFKSNLDVAEPKLTDDLNSKQLQEYRTRRNKLSELVYGWEIEGPGNIRLASPTIRSISKN